jgi:hypothetical protein
MGRLALAVRPIGFGYSTWMLLALAFDPIFVYVAVGLCAVIAIARLVLSWAVGFSD